MGWSLQLVCVLAARLQRTILPDTASQSRKSIAGGVSATIARRYTAAIAMVKAIALVKTREVNSPFKQNDVPKVHSSETMCLK